jgi:hypothetical protein
MDMDCATAGAGLANAAGKRTPAVNANILITEFSENEASPPSDASPQRRVLLAVARFAGARIALASGQALAFVAAAASLFQFVLHRFSPCCSG